MKKFPVISLALTLFAVVNFGFTSYGHRETGRLEKSRIYTVTAILL